MWQESEVVGKQRAMNPGTQLTFCFKATWAPSWYDSAVYILRWVFPSPINSRNISKDTCRVMSPRDSKSSHVENED